MEIYLYLIFFIFGITLGSFYNVLGFRVPLKQSIIKPGSHCQTCLKKLKWYELIPVLSFIIQKGKCRHCQSKLSFFYPFIELATGILFVVSYHSFGFTWELLISLILVSLLMIVIVADLTYLIIPDSFIIIPSILIFIIKIIDLGFLMALKQVGFGIISFLLMYSIMLLGNKIFQKESLGGADIKLMFISGLLFNPILSIVVIFLSSVIALPVSIIVLIKNKDHIIPFGPFIVIALLIVNFMKLNITDLFEKILNIWV